MREFLEFVVRQLVDSLTRPSSRKFHRAEQLSSACNCGKVMSAGSLAAMVKPFNRFGHYSQARRRATISALRSKSWSDYRTSVPHA